MAEVINKRIESGESFVVDFEAIKKYLNELNIPDFVYHGDGPGGSSSSSSSHAP